jgi:hypothetical protein
VTDVNDHAYDTDLLGTPSQRVMVVGNQLQATDAVETKYVRLQSG